MQLNSARELTYYYNDRIPASVYLYSSKPSAGREARRDGVYGVVCVLHACWHAYVHGYIAMWPLLKVISRQVSLSCTSTAAPLATIGTRTSSRNMLRETVAAAAAWSL